MNDTQPTLIRIGIHVGVAYRELKLAQPVLSIGRGTPGSGPPPDVDFARDESVSRRHATIKWAEGAYHVVDLGSTNGTWVNGRRIEPNVPVALCNGDRVAVGRISVFTVTLPTEEKRGAEE